MCRDSQQDIPTCSTYVLIETQSCVTMSSRDILILTLSTCPFSLCPVTHGAESHLHSLRMLLLLWPQVTFYWMWTGLSSQRSAEQRPLPYWRAHPPQWYSKPWKSRNRSSRKTAAQQPWTPTTMWPRLVTGPHPGSCGWNYHSESWFNTPTDYVS